MGEGEAEVKRDGLRSELAERGLESLTGEGVELEMLLN